MNMNPVAERQKSLLKVFDSELKRLDIKYLQDIYKRDKIFQNAIEQISSSEFRQMIAGSHHNTVAFLHEVQKNNDRCRPLFTTFDKRLSQIRDSMLKGVIQSEPNLRKLSKLPTIHGKELARDFEAFIEIVEKIFLSNKLEIESIVHQVHVSDAFGSETQKYHNQKRVDIPLLTRRVGRGEVLLSGEYLSELLDSARNKRNAPNTHSETDAIKECTDWLGDQSVSYDGETLRIGSLPSAKVPGADDAENRRVLLTMLVRNYREEEEDGMGITQAFFQRKLKDIGLPSGKSALDTAKLGINKEVEKAFGFRHFIRMRGGAAYIFKKRKGE